ncbi:MAG: DeoR family transcriptional regulator [Patescibacteria group bacterium]|jgi:transcriptional regulator of heat shock response|nr:DeoR family transcriptional regulator [Patescibacteria group bacterium]
MNERKQLILNTIIKEYISTGIPVSSGVLVDKYSLEVSPATVRNDMVYLENEGHIVQPHTSAGRIPTEDAYRFYLENISDKKLAQKDFSVIKDILSNGDEKDFKQVAKEIAKLSGQTVFWAFHKNSLYYTGVSNLLNQPEFRQADVIYDISLIIDHMDETIEKVFEGLPLNENVILLGSENPFGDMCGTVMFKYKHKNNMGLFGIMGPVRMDYQYCLSIANFIKEELNSK